jgi:hypothetical protein
MHEMSLNNYDWKNSFSKIVSKVFGCMRIWVRVMYLYTNPINYSHKNLSMLSQPQKKKVEGAMLTTCEFRCNLVHKKVSVQHRQKKKCRCIADILKYSLNNYLSLFPPQVSFYTPHIKFSVENPVSVRRNHDV